MSEQTIAVSPSGWGGLSRQARGAITTFGVALAVLAAYNVPGLGPFLDDKAPFGIVVAGIIVGTVTALLAMGLILIYRSEEHTSELQSLMRLSYAVFRLKKQKLHYHN